MRCRACHGTDIKVLATTTSSDRITRRRECGACGERWTTHELHEKECSAMTAAGKLMVAIGETIKELKNVTA